MGSLWRTVLILSLCIPTIAARPLKSTSRRQEPPAALDATEKTAAGVVDIVESAAQEDVLLGIGLLKASTGDTKSASSLEEALGSLASIPSSRNHGIAQTSMELAKHGLAPEEVLDTVNGLTETRINLLYNDNSLDPVDPIYPKKASWDAPYDVSEDELRSAIHIPRDFKQSADGKRPVLLVPGGSAPAGTTFYFNYEKLLSNTSFADPVWVNIPDNSLGDVQVAAEYVAYAMNYVSGISNSTKIGVISYSQGAIAVQWALKYWPSTRDSVDDFMPLSAGFHGSLLEIECISSDSGCTPANRQQFYNSTFIHTLHKDDGDSAFVPTTSVYSGFDQVVEPQKSPRASAELRDIRGVGVMNSQIQLACPGKTAGSVYLHETMLVNPLAYALFVDALTHDGPGDLSRIDLDEVCDQVVPPGLDLDDFLGTEVAATGLGTVNSMMYGNHSNVELPLKMYAK